MFTKIQRIRLPRAQFMLKRAAALQRLTAEQSRIGKVLFPLLLPLASRHTELERFSHSYYGAVKLDMLDTPRRPRAIPFNDELPAKPIKRIKFPTFVAAGLLVALAYLGPKALRMTPPHILNTFAGTSVLKTEYTGLPSIDGLLSVLVSAFSYPLAGTDSSAIAQITYFLPTLAPVLMIWTIESYRIGHRLSLISL